MCSSPPERNLFVQRSLSVLVPVKNAQSTLNDAVHEILDVMADSGDRFEVLIIDDGSTDATSEVAHELTRHYPQIRLIRHGRPRGREAAVRTGLERSQGQVVMLHNDGSGFSMLERPSRAASVAASKPARPNYLRRVKDFALGE
jgi:cellulose synthase/poly-beta-1,6-N-acetylglucosamine synthase-like glycosyltransferase